MHPFPLVLFGILCIFGIAFFSTNHWMPVFKEFKSNKLMDESKPYLDGTFSDSFASTGTSAAWSSTVFSSEKFSSVGASLPETVFFGFFTDAFAVVFSSGAFTTFGSRC